MVGLNRLIVIGNVGTDLEMRYTQSGNPMTTFRLAQLVPSPTQKEHVSMKLSGSQW